MLEDKRTIFLHLHSVTEVGSSGDGHHGQEARSSPDVQDDHSFTSSLYSGHSSPDALIVLLVLKESKIFQINCSNINKANTLFLIYKTLNFGRKLLGSNTVSR